MADIVRQAESYLSVTDKLAMRKVSVKPHATQTLFSQVKATVWYFSVLDQNKSKISRGRAEKYKFRKKNIEPIFGNVNVEKNKPRII